MSNKVPQIRFNGYSDAWEERKLEELTLVLTGFPFKNEDFVDNGKYLVITNGNIQNESSTVDVSLGNRVDDLSDEIKERYYLNKNDILVTMDGTVGRTAKVVDDNMILAQRVARLVANKNTEFVYQWLNQGSFFNEMTKVSHGGTIKHISLNEISNYSATVPSNNIEQQKIGSFFKQFDNTIDLHQRKLDLLKEQKKGYLQKMFPKNGAKVPELRFAGFADDWEERKLGDFIKISREQEVKKVDLHEEKIGYYVLAMRTFDFEGYIDYSKPYWINNFESADDDLFLNRKEFAIIDADMDASLPKIGKVLLNATNNKFLLAAHIRKIKVDVQVDSIFAYALMRTTELVERLKLEANGSISKRLLDKNVYKQKVYLPIHLEEQQQIGEFFWTLEETIALHQRKLDLLKKQKKDFYNNYLFEVG
ncbi:restriction endonuclease subunit S [Lactiplantibacillus plantarum]|uniref:restriction endonuclease subunit S n=1 Tax=Lactiplantibacillus plantarum TaxID=1590 RepID=UPI0030795731